MVKKGMQKGRKKRRVRRDRETEKEIIIPSVLFDTELGESRKHKTKE